MPLSFNIIIYIYIIILFITHGSIVCELCNITTLHITLNTFSQPLKRRKISSVATTWKYVNTVLSEEEIEGKSGDMTGASAITKLSPCNN